MASRRPILGHADERPRVHVWGYGKAIGWSIGPTGRITPAESIGAAVDAAVEHLCEEPAVIFWMGRESA